MDLIYLSSVSLSDLHGSDAVKSFLQTQLFSLGSVSLHRHESLPAKLAAVSLSISFSIPCHQVHHRVFTELWFDPRASAYRNFFSIAMFCEQCNPRRVFVDFSKNVIVNLLIRFLHFVDTVTFNLTEQGIPVILSRRA